MFSYTRGSRRSLAALMAVLQAILLTSALVLGPLAAIAQDPEPESSPAQQADELAVDEAPPAPTERPGPTKDNAKPEANPASDPQAKPDPQPATEPATPEPQVKIRLFPKQLTVRPGGHKSISAWTCPADDHSPYGKDKEPGTRDDDCEPIDVDWSLSDRKIASLTKKEGHRTRVKLTVAGDTKVIAKADGMIRKAKLVSVEPPDEPVAKPAAQDGDTPTKSVDATTNEPTAAPTEEPVADPTDEPQADPTDEATGAPTDQPSTDPTDTPAAQPSDAPTEEPVADPTDEPQADPTDEATGAPTDQPSTDPTDTPAAQPSDAPTEEPVADPTDEPQADPTDEATGAPTDQPSTDPTDTPAAQPSDAPTEEPVADPTDEPTNEPCDIDPFTGECLQVGSGDEPGAETPGDSELPAPACDIDPFTGECVSDQGTDEGESSDGPIQGVSVAASQESGSFTVAATGTLRLRKAGFRDGSGTNPGLSPLAGASFKVYRADSDNNFEPGGDDVLIGTFGPTNGSGIFDVDLNIDQGDDFWVQEESISNSDWNVVKQYALGDNNAAGTTTQYAFKYNLGPGATTSTRWFVNRLDNNAYPEACGLKVALVFDRSGSMAGEYGDLKDAGKLFVDALTGTPSEFAIYSFSEQATNDLGWTSVASSATTVNNAIDNLPGTGGGTNWDIAFRTVAGDGAEVIVFLTDGNPTTYGGGGGSTSTVNPEDVEYGVASANLAKSQSANPKVVAVGVNNAGLNYLNLSLISGPTENDDYYLTNFANLGNTLKQIAEELCGGSVTVIKEVPANGGGWEPAGGWTFSADSNGAAPTPASGDTANGTGAINFDYDNINNVTATITETAKNGWAIVPQGGKNAVCTRNGGDGINESNTTNRASRSRWVPPIS